MYKLLQIEIMEDAIYEYAEITGFHKGEKKRKKEGKIEAKREAKEDGYID